MTPDRAALAARCAQMCDAEAEDCEIHSTAAGTDATQAAWRNIAADWRAAAALLREPDLTPDLRADCLAFVRRIAEYRCHRAMDEDELPFNVCDYYAMDDLAARLAVPPAASEPSDEAVARELAKMLHTETLFGVREDAFVSPVQLVRAVSAARERAKEAR